MGPLTSSSATSSWLPHDDLLLTNSIQKGASFESLAKGAVQFSRKFTVQELRDRWSSLLYDQVVSAKASAAMIEQDCLSISSKFTRSGGSAEKHGVPAKRKSESIRSCYYALRKKRRNQTFDSMDLSFIITPSNGDDSMVCDSMLEDPISDQLRAHDSNLNIMHREFVNPLPDFVSAIDTVDTGSNFSNGLHGSVREYFPIHIDELQNDISGGVGENFPITGNSSEIEVQVQPENFPQSNTCKTDDLQSLPQSTFSDPGNVCLDYEKNQVFNSPISDCGASVYNSKHPSTTENPMVGTVDEFSAKAFSVDVSIKSNDLHLLAGDTCANGDDNVIPASTSDYNDDSVSKLQNEATGDADACTQHYLTELSIRLLNFTDEEDFLFMDADGKEIIDKSYYEGLSSLLQKSPNDDNHKLLSNTSVLEKSVVSNTHIMEPPEARDGEFTNMAHNIRIEIEMCDTFSCCTLNTEDTEIPCNDDVLLPGNQKMIERGPGRTQKEHNNQKPLPVSSQMVMPNITPEVGQFNQAGIYPGVPNNSIIGKHNEEAENMAERKHLSNDLPAVGIQSLDLDVCRRSLGGISQELRISEPAVNHPISDAEEQHIESDDDIPYFSDIEAMILDMDLAPYDQDLSQSAEVLKYQQEDTKRTIIRLEQGANTCMQRSIASRGAFAVLYGRHSKHYIKKPEVMLGRSTEDDNVDIDLGREGCANKISRRQAIIRMDGEGSFYLNNLGKCLVSVNGNEVAPGQGLKLQSGCLIEIRGIPFIFETNHTRVRQYLDSVFQEIEANEP